MDEWCLSVCPQFTKDVHKFPVALSLTIVVLQETMVHAGLLGSATEGEMFWGLPGAGWWLGLSDKWIRPLFLIGSFNFIGFDLCFGLGYEQELS
ncbi:hypothetical protein Ahy_A02g006057 isoform B [Arachis hypogaea]|uniref:Uncharacterized protein n=1 Tax=Arachis hypogaea TaxID=3818 RepID=A0A445E999_ARAHY|nr:hypothetical protein Ahy_A02g006057 isoform B [Arachis hypogaea]